MAGKNNSLIKNPFQRSKFSIHQTILITILLFLSIPGFLLAEKAPNASSEFYFPGIGLVRNFVGEA